MKVLLSNTAYLHEDVGSERHACKSMCSRESNMCFCLMHVHDASVTHISHWKTYAYVTFHRRWGWYFTTSFENTMVWARGNTTINLVCSTYIIHCKNWLFWQTGHTVLHILRKTWCVFIICACGRYHSATEWPFRSQSIETKHCVFEGPVDGPYIFTRVWCARGIALLVSLSGSALVGPSGRQIAVSPGRPPAEPLQQRLLGNNVISYNLIALIMLYAFMYIYIYIYRERERDTCVCRRYRLDPILI